MNFKAAALAALTALTVLAPAADAGLSSQYQTQQSNHDAEQSICKDRFEMANFQGFSGGRANDSRIHVTSQGAMHVMFLSWGCSSEFMPMGESVRHGNATELKVEGDNLVRYTERKPGDIIRSVVGTRR